MKIAICDDDKFISSEIETELLKLSKEISLEVEVDVFYDGNELVEYIKKGNDYDIIYLDIEMRKKDGVKAARELRTEGNRAIIIYVTSYECFAVEVFEVDAFRFLTKPIDKIKFKKYFEDAIKVLKKTPHYFRYKYKKVSYRIPINEIEYFQSDKRVTYIITNTTEYKCYDKLNDIEMRLQDNEIYFYRTHQSFLVNPLYVKKYMFDSMELMDGTVLSISERRRKKVSELFCKIKGEDIIVL